VDTPYFQETHRAVVSNTASFARCSGCTAGRNSSLAHPETSDPRAAGRTKSGVLATAPMASSANCFSSRERLRPYIMRQMKLASTKGVPPMRPLFFDFPDDAAAQLWMINSCSARPASSPRAARRCDKRKSLACRRRDLGGRVDRQATERRQTITAAAPLEKISVVF